MLECLRGMKIFVKTKPGAKREEVKEERGEGRFVVSVKAAAKDGKANRAVEKAIAKHFGVPVSRVKIISGHSSRQKVLSVD